MTEQRLAAPDTDAASDGRGARIARIVLVVTAALFGLVVLIQGLSGD